MRNVLLAALVLVSCATPRAIVPEAEQARVARELNGQQRFLRVAANAGPLWGDTGKLFLTDQPIAEIDLVETAGGSPIAPRFERVLPPGTPVRIVRVEFPSSYLLAQRVVTTPRYHPWVYLKVGGEARPHVVVLSQLVATYDDVLGELERLLTTEDSRDAFDAFAPEVREAILRKEAIEGMSARALEMAWGVPERKRIDRPARTEEWIWPAGKRRAYLREDRVERLEK
jgi:hypothetical protein